MLLRENSIVHTVNHCSFKNEQKYTITSFPESEHSVGKFNKLFAVSQNVLRYFQDIRSQLQTYCPWSSARVIGHQVI